MRCTSCGSELEDGARFCVKCGTAIQESADSTQAIPAQNVAPTQQLQQTAALQPNIPQQTVQPQAAPKKSLAIPIAIAAIIIVAIIIVLVVVFVLPGNDESTSSPTSVESASSSTANPTAPVTFENAVFRITLPENKANMVRFQKDKHMDIVYMYDTSDDNRLLAEILPQNQASDYSGEIAHTVYSLGTVDLAGTPDEAIMDLNYVDANGSTIYMGRPESATLPVMTSLEKYLGMTADEFGACIELKTANGFVPANPTCISNGDFPQRLEEKMVASGSPTSAFWGIWAPASKDKAEMEATAQQIKKDTGIDAFVVLTTDWSNLNSEPWYVVSLGQYATEDAAKAALPNVHNYYPDAYVKYSGSKK